MNLYYVFEQGDPVLISVFLLLTGMSLASWYIIIWKTWKLRRERARVNAFVQRHADMPDWPLRETYIHSSGNVAVLLQEANRLRSSLNHYAPEGREKVLTMHLVQTLDSIRLWLDKGLTVLASVGSSAPFIGLFGTVWGIYGALTKIAAEGNASLNVVAGPMGEALVATAVGLFAAIPAVLAYNTFVRMNRVLVQDIRHIAEQLTTYLSVAPVTAPQNKNIRLVEEK